MEITIKINGRIVSVEVSDEVAECYNQGRRKAENLYHEKRRHWDDREFDEYIVATEGLLPYHPPQRTSYVSGKPWLCCCPLWTPARQFSGSDFYSMRCTTIPMMRLDCYTAAPSMPSVILSKLSEKNFKISFWIDPTKSPQVAYQVRAVPSNFAEGDKQPLVPLSHVRRVVNG